MVPGGKRSQASGTGNTPLSIRLVLEHLVSPSPESQTSLINMPGCCCPGRTISIAIIL